MTQRLSEAQRQLTQADKLASVGRLAAGVAHEINNPLTGVLTYASFLLKRAEDRSETKADLEVIVRETKRCREIVNGLLDFARQTPPRRQPTDLNDVARRAVAMVMNRLKLDRVALSLELAADLPEVQADANQMQQVLVNLLVNAADAIGSEGGSIRLSSHGPWCLPTATSRSGRRPAPRGATCSIPRCASEGCRPSGWSACARGASRWSTWIRSTAASTTWRRRRARRGPRRSCAVPGAACPSRWPGSRCRKCGAATFAVHVPGKGKVEWCSRVGCHWAFWKEMEAEGEQPVVELEVEDNGRGIAAQDLPHLFEPFFSTKGTRGTGLGLAVSWGIVEGHGGTIEVQSEPGKGSRFTVRLPMGPAEKPPAAGDAGEAVPVGAEHAG